MKQKIEIINFKISERELLEQHLNEMSEKGWNISWIDRNVIHYKKSNEKKQYFVDINTKVKWFQPHRLDEDYYKQKDMYESMGFDFICNYLYFVIFENNSEIKTHTDEYIEEKIIEKAEKRAIRNQIIIPTLLFLSASLYFNISNSSYFPLLCASAAQIFLCIITPLFYIVRNIIELGFKTRNIYMIKLRSIIQLLLKVLYNVGIIVYMQISYDNIKITMILLIILILISLSCYINSRSLRKGNEQGMAVTTVPFLYCILFSVMLYGVYWETLGPTKRTLVDIPIKFSEELVGGENIEYIKGYNDETFILKDESVRFKTEEYIMTYDYYKIKCKLLENSLKDSIIQSYIKTQHLNEPIQIEGINVYLNDKKECVVIENNSEIFMIYNAQNGNMNEEYAQLLIKELGWLKN